MEIRTKNNVVKSLKSSDYSLALKTKRPIKNKQYLSQVIFIFY